VLGSGERHQLDLVELMLPDEPRTSAPYDPASLRKQGVYAV
jgi:hypothetical protein